MTGFHWTGLEIAALVLTPLLLALGIWMHVQGRRDEREIAQAAAESAARSARRAAELRAERVVFGPVAAGRVPPRSVGRVPVPPIPSDEAGLAEAADLLFGEATRLCRAAVEHAANVRLMDEYAARYPMKIRPGLVEQGETND